MRYKIIFSDYDKTISLTNTISFENITAIKKYVDLGGTFVLCTARNSQSIVKVIDQNNLKSSIRYLICNQGAIVFDLFEDKILYSLGIDKLMVESILKYTEEKSIFCLIYYAKNFCAAYETELSIKWSNTLGITPEYANMPLSSYSHINDSTIFRVVLIDTNDKIIDEAYNYLKSKKDLDIIRSSKNMLEIINAKVSKGNSVTWLINFLNTEKSNTLSIGDSKSDVSMFNATGVSVATANADDVCFNFAQIKSSLSCEQHCVASIIQKII